MFVINDYFVYLFTLAFDFYCFFVNLFCVLFVVNTKWLSFSSLWLLASLYFYHYDMLFYKYIWYKSVLSYMYHFFAGGLLYFQVFHCDF